MTPNTYRKVVTRTPKSEQEEKEIGEQPPNLKDQWLEEKQTQHFLLHLTDRRQELLNTVAQFAYNNGNIGSKQLSQLIEAESIKISIENYTTQ